MNPDQFAQLSASDSAQLARVQKCAAFLMQREPFLGSLIRFLRLVPSRRVRTMTTDGRVILFNPDYVANLLDAQIVGMLAHEVQHCALKHFARRGLRPMAQWNVATDHAINLQLKPLGFVLWEGHLADPKYKGLAAEDIFSALYPPEPPQAPSAPEQGEGEEGEEGEQENGPGSAGQEGEEGQEGEGEESPSQGSEGEESPSEGEGESGSAGQGEEGEEGEGNGASAGQDNGPGSEEGEGGSAGQASGSAGQGGAQKGEEAPSDGASAHSASAEGEGEEADQTIGQDWQPGGVVDAGSLSDPEEGESTDPASLAQQWEVQTRQAIGIARKYYAGKLPGHIQEIVEEYAKPRIDFRAQLREFITESQSYDYSWNRPNRRFVASGLYLPGKVSDSLNHLAVIVDTSASTRAYLPNFAGEMEACLEDGLADRFTVIYCDTRVCAVEELERGDTFKFEPKGFGGTRFSPAIEYVSDNCPDVAAVLFFTDLECSDFGSDPGLPVLWVQAAPSRYAFKPPYGDVIQLDVYA